MVPVFQPAGLKMITSDDHAGLKAALQAALTGVPWQRCQFHLGPNLLDHIPKGATRTDSRNWLRRQPLEAQVIIREPADGDRAAWPAREQNRHAGIPGNTIFCGPRSNPQPWRCCRHRLDYWLLVQDCRRTKHQFDLCYRNGQRTWACEGVSAIS